MESPRKFNDCYFYYYSTCTKGDNCVFRHEPSALGCETMCVQWQQGRCLDKRCKLRHMELRKNRKQIPCYWENQPGGCRKKHCPFQHKNPEARTDGIAPSQPQPANKNPSAPIAVSPETEPPLAPAPAPHPAHAAPAPPMLMSHELVWQQQPRQVVLDSAILGVLPSSDLLGRRGPPAPHDPAAMPPYASIPVDPLVVNFEEESDNESAPSSTPTKMVSPDEGGRGAGGKSQELMLLEQIQAEAAAYYSYDEQAPTLSPPAERRTVRTNYARLSLDEISGRPRHPHDLKRNSLDFTILSLDEIRARKRANDPVQTTGEHNACRKRKLSTHDTILAPNKVIKVVRNNSLVYKKVTDGTDNTNTDIISVNEDRDGSRKRTLSPESDILVTNNVELDDCLKTVSTNLPARKIRKIEDNQKDIKMKIVRTHSESEENICDIKLSDTSSDVNVEATNASSVIVLDDDTYDMEVESNAEPNIVQPIVISDEDSALETVAENKETLNETERVTVPVRSSSRKEVSESSVIDTNKVSEDSSNDSITPEIENSLRGVNVPDVVASCHGDKYKARIIQKEDGQGILNYIDTILNEESL